MPFTGLKRKILLHRRGKRSPLLWMWVIRPVNYSYSYVNPDWLRTGVVLLVCLADSLADNWCNSWEYLSGGKFSSASKGAMLLAWENCIIFSERQQYQNESPRYVGSLHDIVSNKSIANFNQVEHRAVLRRITARLWRIAVRLRLDTISLTMY